MGRSRDSRVNDQLRHERIRRNWRQHDLAEQLGTTVVTVKRWERGSQQPSSYFLHKLCALFEKSAEELGFIPNGYPVASSLLQQEGAWSIPFPRNPFFTGRDLLLTQLHRSLTGELKRAIHTRSYALHGMGGIGKTQLAIEYAYRHRSEYHVVFWVEAETQESLMASFARFAGMLALLKNAEEDQNKIVVEVLRWLNQHDDWLLILDNVEELSLIRPFLPANDKGALLFTTRLHSLGTLARRVDLAPLTVQEGSEFLLARTNRLCQNRGCAAIDKQEHAAARMISMEMGGLPLALEQAGAHIEATQCCLSSYLRLFRQIPHHLLDEHEPFSDHSLSVSQTFLQAFEQVAQLNPFAAELLTACSFLAPEAIPEAFFLEGASSLGPVLATMVADPLAFSEAIKVLLSCSLLQRQGVTGTIIVHRLVQVVLKARLMEAQQRIWGRRIIDTMSRLFPADAEAPTSHRSIGVQLITHAQACLLLADQWGYKEAPVVVLRHRVRAYLFRGVRTVETEQVLRRSVQMEERILGRAHLLFTEAISGQAGLHLESGEFTDVEPLFKHVSGLRVQD